MAGWTQQDKGDRTSRHPHHEGCALRKVDAGQHDIGWVVLKTRLHSPRRGPCLAREVDAGQHEVLGVVVEHREGQVEALQEDQRRRQHLLREPQRAAQPLPGPGTRTSCKGSAEERK